MHSDESSSEDTSDEIFSYRHKILETQERTRYITPIEQQQKKKLRESVNSSRESMPDEFVVTGDFELRTSTDARPRGKIGLGTGKLNKLHNKENIKKDTQELTNRDKIKIELDLKNKTNININREADIKDDKCISQESKEKNKSKVKKKRGRKKLFYGTEYMHTRWEIIKKRRGRIITENKIKANY